MTTFLLAAEAAGNVDAGKAIALALGIGLGSLGAGIGIGNIFGSRASPSSAASSRESSGSASR